MEQAMYGPDEKGFREACEKELATLVDMDAWEVVDRKPKQCAIARNHEISGFISSSRCT